MRHTVLFLVLAAVSLSGCGYFFSIDEEDYQPFLKYGMMRKEARDPDLRALMSGASVQIRNGAGTVLADDKLDERGRLSAAPRLDQLDGKLSVETRRTDGRTITGTFENMPHKPVSIRQSVKGDIRGRTRLAPGEEVYGVYASLNGLYSMRSEPGFGHTSSGGTIQNRSLINIDTNTAGYEAAFGVNQHFTWPLGGKVRNVGVGFRVGYSKSDTSTTHPGYMPSLGEFVGFSRPGSAGILVTPLNVEDVRYDGEYDEISFAGTLKKDMKWCGYKITPMVSLQIGKKTVDEQFSVQLPIIPGFSTEFRQEQKIDSTYISPRIGGTIRRRVASGISLFGGFGGGVNFVSSDATWSTFTDGSFDGRENLSNERVTFSAESKIGMNIRLLPDVRARVWTGLEYTNGEPKIKFTDPNLNNGGARIGYDNRLDWVAGGGLSYRF